MNTPRRVLVVDDEASIRTLLQKVLERAGYAVDCARDGCEAIERLAADDYDVVLLDLMMPKLDGYGVVDSIKLTRPDLLHRTILVTAAHTRQMYKLPVRGIITKPFSLTDLLRETHDCADPAESPTDGGPEPAQNGAILSDPFRVDGGVSGDPSPSSTAQPAHPALRVDRVGVGRQSR